MKRLPILAVAAAAAGLLVGCELDVENPNSPDASRAFQDPSGLQQLMGGAFRTWAETRGDYYSSLPMTAMADNYTASWNNAAIRYYSSVGVECPSRCGWNNSATAPEAAGGPSVEYQWYGYYTVLSAANDVLRAIDQGLCFDSDCSADNTVTSRNGAMAKMLQGMAFAGIAMVYDSGFAVTEDTDASDPLSLPFNGREEMRDAALASFEEAWSAAGAKSWSTPPEWMGVGAGTSYTNIQMRQLIRTMQAELIAMYPRSSAENAQANWSAADGVVKYASEGISSGAPFEWQFFIDPQGVGIDYVKLWGNSLFTMRVDTRVAHMLVPSHLDPWPEPDGNPCPYAVSADKRVGDGTYGPEDDFSGGATFAATANAGTDFACSGVAIFPPARGQYHQSNLQHIRYQRLAYEGEGLPGFNGSGQDPFYTPQMNDLLWAEGLIRTGNLGLAAEKINNSRVGRGGLPPVAADQAALTAALQYEQEIEFMGQGPTPFFNRRRVDGLLLGTPRHMPVPAKEMDVLVREIYSYGGPSFPDMSAGRETRAGVRVRSVRDIYAEYRSMRRLSSMFRR